ncbi:MAG: polysaccharide deacetylase family protein [Elusimicrobia bacterium]|nr:polysaccharide deacetylase family protein [Candidatus Obscuribacterium magneticum]
MLSNPYFWSGLFIVGTTLCARWNWWRLPKEGIPILLFHKVGVPPKGSKLEKLWVSIDHFKKQMNTLARLGYQAVTFKDIYRFWDGGPPLPQKPVVITFDDGYLSNFTEAFPVMKELGFRGVVFVVVETVGGQNEWHNPKTEARVPMATWAQLAELRNAGWEIGSHTLTHRNLATLELEDVQREMDKSRLAIGQYLGEIPQTFAYPYGGGEDRDDIRACAKKSGYRLGVGIHAGKWTLAEFQKCPFALPRVFVRGDDLMYDFHLQLTRGRSRL